MRYFSKLLTLTLCICNVHCSTLEQLIYPLSKTNIADRTHRNLEIVYKNDSPKSSPALYNSITISQDKTNQSTIINKKVNNEQLSESILIANKNQNNIINSKEVKISDKSILLNKHSTSDNHSINKTNKNQIIKNQVIEPSITDKINNNINGNILDGTYTININISQNEEINKNMVMYDNSMVLHFENNEKYIYKSWERILSPLFKINNQEENNYCTEYLTSRNLLQAIDLIYKLVDLIYQDVTKLKQNEYFVNYINNFEFISKYYNVNNDNIIGKSSLFPCKYVKHNKNNRIIADAMTFLLHKSFKTLYDLLESLDSNMKNGVSILQLVDNKSRQNISELQLVDNKSRQNISELLEHKNEIKQSIKQYKTNLKNQIKKGNQIKKQITQYETAYDKNEIILEQLKNNSKKNNNIDKVNKNIKQINKNIKQINENIKQINEKQTKINNAINFYNNNIKDIIINIKNIKTKVDEQYQKYNMIRLMCDYTYILEEIDKNLNNCSSIQEKVDFCFKKICREQELVLTTINNKSNDKQIIDVNITKNNSNNTEQNKLIEQITDIHNELNKYKTGIKYYVESLIDMVKQMFKTGKELKNIY